MPRYTLPQEGTSSRCPAAKLGILVPTICAVGLLFGVSMALADTRLVADLETTPTGSRPKAFLALGEHVVHTESGQDEKLPLIA